MVLIPLIECQDIWDNKKYKCVLMSCYISQIDNVNKCTLLYQNFAHKNFAVSRLK